MPERGVLRPAPRRPLLAFLLPARLFHPRLCPGCPISRAFWEKWGFRSLSRHHLERLPDQLLQLSTAHRVQPVEDHPLITTHIGRWTNIFPFNQLGEGLRLALETHLLGNRGQGDG